MLNIEIKPNGEAVKTSAKKKRYEEYELECKARTLMEAKEIEADEELMALLAPYIEKKANAIESIADLRKRAAKLAQKSESGEQEQEPKSKDMSMPQPEDAEPKGAVTIYA